MKKLLVIVSVLVVLDLSLKTSAEVDCTGKSCYKGSKAAVSYPGMPSVNLPDNGTSHLLPRSAPQVQLTSFKCGSVSCPEGDTCCGDSNCCEQTNGFCCADPQYCCANGHFCCGTDIIWCCANSQNCSEEFGHCTGGVSPTVGRTSSVAPTSTVPTGAGSPMDIRVWVRALPFVVIALLAVR